MIFIESPTTETHGYRSITRPKIRGNIRKLASAPQISDGFPKACGGVNTSSSSNNSREAISESISEGQGDDDPDPELGQQNYVTHKPQHQSTTSFATHKATEPHSLAYPISVVSKKIWICRSGIYQLIQQNKFPKPIKIGRSSRWLATELEDWIAKQVSIRDEGEA